MTTCHQPHIGYGIHQPSVYLIFFHDPHKRVGDYMILFQKIDSYYAFSAYIDEDNMKQNFGLLDLGGQSNDPCPNANLSWKTVNISEFDKLRRPQNYNSSFLQSKGIIYILVPPEVGLSNPKIICSDLVKQQTCATLNLPDQSLCFNSKEVCFRNWRGNPAVTYVLEEKLNTRVLEDYKTQKWADTIQIPMPFLKEQPSWNKKVPHINFDDDGEVFLQYWMVLTWWKYDPKLKQMCKDLSAQVRVPATLTSVKGMQSGKKERRAKRKGPICGLDGLFREVRHYCKDTSGTFTMDAMDMTTNLKKTVVENETEPDKLNEELDAARMDESYAHNLLEEWQIRVEELEIHAEKANHLEKSTSD
ncbi:hypothetical protein POM88_041899 [Heracleum sosnowskyi]|uniref:Uncharacterized protein n=1 Tax=Heracleum sosnowskyi TaxID=360622 RepID=A0AAD8HGU4_9APIA|nr:hypothetical protein POM88_041899 [Heracleum sosnowskyi]